MNQIEHYLTQGGQDLYQLWLEIPNDLIAKAIITARINRLATGAFGDCKPVGGSVWELRIPHGPGYRVYYAKSGKKLILLLLGGDKRRQSADIKKAFSAGKITKGESHEPFTQP